jgi:hypothetical protein
MRNFGATVQLLTWGFVLLTPRSSSLSAQTGTLGLHSLRPIPAAPILFLPGQQGFQPPIILRHLDGLIHDLWQVGLFSLGVPGASLCWAL